MADVSYNVGGVLLPRPFKIGRLGHVAMYYEDMDRAGRFYQELLGYRFTDVLGGIESHPKPRAFFYTHNTDHHSFGVQSADIARSRDARYENGVTINQLSFQVGTLDEVVAAHAFMRDSGVPIFRVGRDRPGSNYAVYFIDPDGHTCELYYGMEQIGWDGRSKPQQAFQHLSVQSVAQPPMPADALEVFAVEAKGHDLSAGHRSLEQREGRFNVGGILLPRPFRVVGAGPVSLFVKDMEASLRFWRDLMGLQVTETSDVQGHTCHFLRLGSEHHTIALLPIGLRALLQRPTRTTLGSYGVRVGSWQQLHDAAQWLREHGCEEYALPPELHPGIEYAAHFVDPEGHGLQLHFDMERIGWDGRPRPAAQRRRPAKPWPQQLEATSDTWADRSFQGPLG
jgi:catechol 2,3-dioxygenase-like lactoylglutathione lyase family enzyme